MRTIMAAVCAAMAITIMMLSASGAASANEGVKAMGSSENATPVMDPATKSAAFHSVVQKMGAGEKIDPGLWNEFVQAQNDGVATGPAVGEKVPDFTLPDQNGREWSPSQLMGPKGLLLVFVRSADW
jgi:hypothetical protein